jgi:hypothetical protein
MSPLFFFFNSMTMVITERKNEAEPMYPAVRF